MVIGASGALYGLLVAYAVYFPQTEVLLWFILPMKMWVLVSLWVGISLFYSVFGSGGGIAHLAHLGGRGLRPGLHPEALAPLARPQRPPVPLAPQALQADPVAP